MIHCQSQKVFPNIIRIDLSQYDNGSWFQLHPAVFLLRWKKYSIHTEASYCHNRWLKDLVILFSPPICLDMYCFASPQNLSRHCVPATLEMDICHYNLCLCGIFVAKRVNSILQCFTSACSRPTSEQHLVIIFPFDQWSSSCRVAGTLSCWWDVIILVGRCHVGGSLSCWWNYIMLVGCYHVMARLLFVFQLEQLQIARVVFVVSSINSTSMTHLFIMDQTFLDHQWTIHFPPVGHKCTVNWPFIDDQVNIHHPSTSHWLTINSSSSTISEPWINHQLSIWALHSSAIDPWWLPAKPKKSGIRGVTCSVCSYTRRWFSLAATSCHEQRVASLNWWMSWSCFKPGNKLVNHW